MLFEFIMLTTRRNHGASSDFDHGKKYPADALLMKDPICGSPSSLEHNLDIED